MQHGVRTGIFQIDVANQMYSVPTDSPESFKTTVFSLENSKNI